MLTNPAAVCLKVHAHLMWSGTTQTALTNLCHLQLTAQKLPLRRFGSGGTVTPSARQMCRDPAQLGTHPHTPAAPTAAAGALWGGSGSGEGGRKQAVSPHQHPWGWAAAERRRLRAETGPATRPLMRTHLPTRQQYLDKISLKNIKVTKGLWCFIFVRSAQIAFHVGNVTSLCDWITPLDVTEGCRLHHCAYVRLSKTARWQ